MARSPSSTRWPFSLWTPIPPHPESTPSPLAVERAPSTSPSIPPATSLMSPMRNVGLIYQIDLTLMIRRQSPGLQPCRRQYFPSGPLPPDFAAWLSTLPASPLRRRPGPTLPWRAPCQPQAEFIHVIDIKSRRPRSRSRGAAQYLRTVTSLHASSTPDSEPYGVSATPDPNLHALHNRRNDKLPQNNGVGLIKGAEGPGILMSILLRPVPGRPAPGYASNPIFQDFPR